LKADVAGVRGIYPLADDDPRWKHDPRAVVSAALAGGARVIQLRLKHTRDGDALELARVAVRETRAHGALLIVNDRYDLADLAGADGVHVGQDDLAPERIPAEIRARLLVGLSTHTIEQLEASRKQPIDYVAFGPVFGTTSKDSEYTARGAELLGRAVGEAREARRPLVAIGGIDESTLPAVAAAGAVAAAVISAVTDAADAAAATRHLQYVFDSAAPPQSD